ncbi:MAG: hypothetical protein O2955_15760 [Planctomycetota bacterium]|nr:hypothetical protein [Planctomycetota bacterium]
MTILRHIRGHRSTLIILGACWLIVYVMGCRLWEHSTTWPTEVNNPLPPIPTSDDAMEIQVVFIERPAGDPLIGSLLWQNIDQIGSLDSDLRSMLRRNGLRIGYVSTTPPRALEQLMNLKSPVAQQLYQHDENKLFGRKLVLRSGAESEIQTGEMQQDSVVKIETKKGEEKHEYEQARGVLRIKAERRLEGWASLEIMPEIHYGKDTLRVATSPSSWASATGWMYRSGQKVEALYDYKIVTTLNVGEMVILAAQGDDEESLGRFMFCSPDELGGVGEKQRLIIIRLAGMTKTDPLPQRQVAE